MYDTNLGEEAKVESIIVQGRWTWPTESGAIRDIVDHTPPECMPDVTKKNMVISET